jgi:SdpC family antimicrobial peptide
MLKLIRKISSKPIVILPLAGIFTFVSCRKENITAQLINKTQSEQISSNKSFRSNDQTPENLFRGILFLDGSFAQNIDALAGMVDKRDNAPDSIKIFHKKFADEIIDSIKQRSPSIFAHFKTELKSNDLYRVDNALKNAAKLIDQIARNSPNYKDYFIIADEVKTEVNVASFDLKSKEGIAKFQNTLRQKASDKITQRGRLIIPIFVVYFMVWETVFVVNHIAIFTFIFLIWGLVFVASAERAGDGSNLTAEQLTKQISDAVR